MSSVSTHVLDTTARAVSCSCSAVRASRASPQASSDATECSRTHAMKGKPKRSR